MSVHGLLGSSGPFCGILKVEMIFVIKRDVSFQVLNFTIMV
jgi:hypothetical protein